ncbi:MAG: transglutaminase domain-containing protein [Candidatus Asgardarchaeum sp.]|nr:lasso peptide biosynthesis protein [Candidatus Odinarchaeota archaeon]
MSLFSFFVQKNKGNILRKNKTYTQDETIILTLDISKLPVGTYILKIMDPYNRTIYQQKISRESNRIVGKYILSIPLSESYPDGIYSVYVINIASGSTFKETFIVKNPYFSKREIVLFNYFRIINYNGQEIFDVYARIVKPPHIPTVQEINSITPLNFTPLREETDLDGNEWLVANFEKIDENKSIDIGYKSKITLLRRSYIPAKLSPSDYKKYTNSEPYIESDDPRIIRISESLYHRNFYQFIKNIQKWLHKNISYREMPSENGALFALKNKIGDCTEFSSLFVAICRAANIPSRLVAGIAKGKKWENHAWAECYYDGKWIAVEPTWKEYVGLFGYFTNRITLLYGNWMGDFITRDFSIRYRYHVKRNKERINFSRNIKILNYHYVQEKRKV